MRFLILVLTLSVTPALADPFITLPSSSFQRAADYVQAKYPNLKEANRSTRPKFIDSHPKGLATGHAELAGFGVTMVAHRGIEPKVSFDKILHADEAAGQGPGNGSAWWPNLLFFEKGKSGKTRQWKIIGMGYSLDFDPGNRPWVTIDSQRHYFHVHEAGYHRLSDGGFRCAENGNLKRAARNAGKSIDRRGRQNITRNELKVRANTIRHGRIWTLHVWFNPTTGAPTIAITDPWRRQSSKAKAVPSCAFYDQS